VTPHQPSFVTHRHAPPRSLVVLIASLALMAVAPPSVTESQRPVGPLAFADSTTIAVLDVALFNKRANEIESADTVHAAKATAVEYQVMSQRRGIRLADSSRVRAAAMTREATALAGGIPCNVSVSCARFVGSRLGAEWAVMSKVSKTSDLIWVFSGQLIRVRDGEMPIDDTFELKGDPETMVPRGVRNFAQRVAERAVATGGESVARPR